MKQFYFSFAYTCVFLLRTLNVLSQDNNPGIYFSENLGQWNNAILYRARLDGGALYFEKDALTFNFYDKQKYHAMHMGEGPAAQQQAFKGHALKIRFLDSNPADEISTQEPNSFYENYFIGSNKENWKGHVNGYRQLMYKNVYSGIDYEVKSMDEGIKYNFIVRPGADPTRIALQYSGADKLKIQDNGSLNIQLAFTSFNEKKPYAYQEIKGETKEVKCNYKLTGNILSYEFPEDYDRAYTLVIDPLLVFAAQSGSTADNFGMTATYDNNGNLYSGGTVFDIGYPTTTGAYDITFSGPAAGGNTDVVLTKYSANGSSLLFSTYLGGNESEIVTSLIVDANGNLYAHGATGSSNFPVSSNAYDMSFNGGNYISFIFNGTTFNNGTDLYVTKLNPTGTTLLSSTYIGGSDNDGINYNNALTSYSTNYVTSCPPGSINYVVPAESQPDSLQYNYGDQYRGEIQLDKNGDVYVCSSTRSANFPTNNAFDNSLNGKQDAVVIKLNSTLSNLVWSSYLGGSGNDCGNSLIVDDSLNVYATGGTYSTDFPVTAGSYQTTYNGGKADGYLVKISPSCILSKGTYIGTNDYDQSYLVQSDTSGNIYVFGQSLGNMPVIGPVYSNPGSHQFISRFDSQLTNINLSTVIGSGTSSIDISPSSFGVDYCGNIYISGWGGNIVYAYPTTGLPTTAGALYSTSPNGFDFYVMALSVNASTLTYASYFGGPCSKEHVDGGTSRFDKYGILYQSVCAGCGGYQDFPVTPGAWPNTPGTPNHSNNCNNGVFKLDFQPANVVKAGASPSTNFGCAPLTVSLTNTSNNYQSYTWYFAVGDTSSTILNPVRTFTASGVYTISLVTKNNFACNKKDSIVKIINVSNCTGITENQPGQPGPSIYPNPFADKIIVKAAGKIEKLSVFDSFGKELFSTTCETKSTEINMANLAGGIYFISVTVNGETYYNKLIKIN